VKLNNAHTHSLANNNKATVAEYQNKKLQDTPYYDLPCVLADMLDTIAAGDNCYCVIGSTSSKTAFSIAMNAGAGKDARYGPDLLALSAGAADWL